MTTVHVENLGDGSASDRNFGNLRSFLSYPPTTFTPAWTGAGSNPAIGNGTLTGFYYRVGNLIIATWNIIAGSTTTFGSGQYSVGLPVTAATSPAQRWTLTGDLLDAGVQHYEAVGVVNGSTTFEEILVMSNATGPTNWTATAPFTFGNTDRLTISGVYVAA